jgi:DnaJ-class molecular chaperone
VTTLVAERLERSVRTERSGGPTLERLISGVWHDVSHQATAACPVCAGEMSPATAGAPHGTCSACGTQLW